MNGKKLFELIGSIDENLLEQDAGEKKRVSLLKIALPAAACIALAALAAVLIFNKKPEQIKDAVIPTTEPSALPTAAVPTAVPTGMEGETMQDPEGDACWIAFFRHDGAIYIEHDVLRRDADCVGDYLGESRCTADLKKKNEDYTELTGSFAGPVYTVDGVDPRLLLCSRQENGTVMLFVNETDTADYRFGRDILEDRLHLSENTAELILRVRDADSQSFFRAGAEHTAVRELIALLDGGEVFINTELLPLRAALFFKAENGLLINILVYDECVWLYGHSTDGEDMICIRADGEKLSEFIERLTAEGTPAADPCFTGTTLGDCRADERFGLFVPAAVPEGYTLVYASIICDRAVQQDTVPVTKHIEYELRDADGHYIHVDIDPGDEGSHTEPTLEDVQAAWRALRDRYTVTVLRSGVKIDVTGHFDTPPEDVFAIISSIGE